jgi:hypothetical protein
MGKLTTAERKKLPARDFAGPDRSYPIEDKGHAKAAMARAAEFASPKVKAEVDRKADRKLDGRAGANKDRAADRVIARISKPKPVR